MLEYKSYKSEEIFYEFDDESDSETIQNNRVWKSYSEVYDLMDNLPFVRNLRKRHVTAMKACKFALDGGCGTGLITRDLALRRGRRVIGLDLNEDMLNQAAHRLRDFKNVKLYPGNVLVLPFDEHAFDGYVSNNVLHFVNDSKKFFSEMIRVIKPGGILSISAARPCCDMGILVKATRRYFSHMDFDTSIMKKVNKMIDANRFLLKNVKYMYEPQEVAKILFADYGCSILYQGSAYLGQSFHVIAKK